MVAIKAPSRPIQSLQCMQVEYKVAVQHSIAYCSAIRRNKEARVVGSQYKHAALFCLMKPWIPRLHSPLSLSYPTVCVFRQFSTDQRRKWYVQPGGKGGRKEWSEEDGRVIWEVPQASMFGKVGRRCSDLKFRIANTLH